MTTCIFEGSPNNSPKLKTGQKRIQAYDGLKNDLATEQRLCVFIEMAHKKDNNDYLPPTDCR